MIYIQQLTKYYDEVRALNNVSFEISKGEIMGLLGPNGAGKTTTLRILTCYLPPTSGTIKVKDLDINENPLEIKKLIGYLPESAPLYQDMLVYRYLNYVADIWSLKGAEKRERIHKLAEVCGLFEVMHRPIGECSKGYKQRVGLAHAMMSDPEILILDEPTSGLDPNQIVEIRSIIKEIGKEKTIILSTHILSEVEATCNRIVIINQGEVVADGATDSLKLSSRTGRNVVHISLADAKYSDVQSQLSILPGIKKVSRVTAKDAMAATVVKSSETADSKRQGDKSVQDLLHIEILCNGEKRADIYRKIRENDWVLMEFYKERRTLENVFRELTLSEN